MPNRDATGPNGNGPFTGRGLGRGFGRGLFRGRFFGRGSTVKECTCPECGYREPSQRGIPCTEKKCPKCGVTMKGVNCL
jgi:hypothetical protein